MGMLTNKDYGTTPLRRILAKGIKRCVLGDVRESDRTPDENGNVNAKAPLSKILVNLTLEEPAKTTDGDTVNPGFPVLVTINTWEKREDEARAQFRELNLAVLGMDRNSKDDVITPTDARGGWVGLKGAPLLVEFDVSKDGKYQEVVGYNRIAPQPAT